MHVLQIEHPIRDFDTWKGAFDRFSDFRQQSGVRRYQVLRPTDDPNYVIIELEFDSPSEAEAFLAALRRNVWSSREAAPALLGEPQTRIVEAVEVREY
jgi:quinol monooxygenase YgiN